MVFRDMASEVSTSMSIPSCYSKLMHGRDYNASHINVTGPRRTDPWGNLDSGVFPSSAVRNGQDLVRLGFCGRGKRPCCVGFLFFQLSMLMDILRD